VILVLNLKENLNKNSIIKYEEMIKDKKVIVLPSFPYLVFFRNGEYALGSQDVSKYKEGSYTGEVSAKAIKTIGASYALIGHFERKEYFNETIQDFRMKIQNAVDEELIPIYCVNQSEDDYKNDTELKEIENQLEAIPPYVKYVMISYEPSYMIGAKDAKIDVEHTEKVITKIKEWLMERYINHSILYGGGVKPSNIDIVKELNGIDGLIISSSALEENEFNEIYSKINN
jgi:triosephosphate isomerase